MSDQENVKAHNRRAWDKRVADGNRWTMPVSSEQIARAREGDWEVGLTPSPVPRDWFGNLTGTRVLGLASAGGQQGPILAAAGAVVTVFDLSPAQLAQDAALAEREGLTLTTVEGDMRDLSAFEDESFDLVFHPVANIYVEDVNPVWREAFRVLRPGGSLLSGFYNPVMCLFDDGQLDAGVCVLRYESPYSDMTSISAAERKEIEDSGDPLVFAHSLDDQIGGQIAAGFAITGFFESSRGRDFLPDRFIPTYIATRATKPS